MGSWILYYMVSNLCSGFAPGDEYEQNISLVKNPRCSKRSSSRLSFPELYSQVFINSFIMQYQNPDTI
jgi:hypothetical protein